MKLGDRIRLHVEREPIFKNGKPEIIDGEFTVIGVSYGMSHCFSEHSWSPGFNSFEFGKNEDGRPDIVRVGAIYVPGPHFLDEAVVDDLHYDKKTVSWEVIARAIGPFPAIQEAMQPSSPDGDRKDDSGNN